MKAKILQSCQSTQNEALAYALSQVSQSDPDYWVLSHSQNQGRGRHGRTWLEATGGLYCSCAYRWPKDKAVDPFVTLVAGLALWKTVQNFESLKDKSYLKWPNDLLVHEGPQKNKKLAGVLCEFKNGHLIAGWGMNLLHEPDLENTASLACLGDVPSALKIFSTLQLLFKNELEIFLSQGPQQAHAEINSKAMQPLWGKTLSIAGNRMIQPCALLMSGQLEVQSESGQKLTLSNEELILV